MHNRIRHLGWCLALTVFILLNSPLNGQKKVPYINSVDSISLAIAYSDTGAYAKASRLYETISPNDTNYVLALLEDAISKEANEQDSEAIQICRKGVEQETDYDPDFYNTLANIYMDEGNYTDAIKLLQDTVLPKYTNGHKLYYTLGMAQYKIHKYPDAINSFEKAIDLDIYDALSHYYLGRCCLEQGRLIPALLSLQLYLVLQPQSNRSYTAIGLIEQMTGNKYQYNKLYAVDPSVYHDSAFTELDLLIRSKIAMNKEYPAATKINYDFVKQIQLLLEQLKYTPNTGNYWMEKYVPFFTGVQQKGYLEPYIYFISSSVNDQNLQKDIIKNKKKITEFTNWANGILTTERSKKEMVVNGKKITATCYYFDNNMIQSMGPQNNAGKTTGEWTFYYGHSGIVSGEGKYNDNGERDGKWHWFYTSGKLKETANFINGKREDTVELWHENGARKALYLFHNDLLNGDCREYNISGILSSRATYKDDKITGTATYYYSDGKQHFSADYADGKYEGSLKEYYASGQTKSIASMQNNENNGTYTSYWVNGKVEQTGEYKDNKQIGDWKTFYKTGNLQKEGSYNVKGQAEGHWAYYFNNGKKNETWTCNKNGDIDGVDSLFDKDGILYKIEIYKDGKLQEYTFKDKDGHTTASGKLDGKTLSMQYYTPEGMKKSEGLYVDDQRENVWKYYNGYGNLVTTESYSKGILNGVTMYYFINGKVQDSVNYTNGQKNGYYVSYHINGKMNSQGWYVNGEAEGDWYYYDLKGNVTEHAFYVNGAVHGHSDFYESNGTLSEQLYYRYGYLDKSYVYDSTGTNITYKYISDKGNGRSLVPYNNGTIAHELNYVKGNWDGAEKKYFYNGQLALEGSLLLGERQDTMKIYYENGNIKNISNFSMGDREGIDISYYKNGNIEQTATYSDNELSGEQKWYLDNGKLCTVNHYDEDGNMEGERKFCYSDSLTGAIFFYHNGNIIGYSSADKNGNPLQRVAIDKGTGDIACSYPNGNKSIVCKFENGSLQGKRLKYAPDGHLLSDENFEWGNWSGLQKYYNYGDTTLKEEANYYYGELDGICRYYYKTGKLEHDESYVLGTKQGPSRYYDKEGKLIKTVFYFDGDETMETKAK